MQGKDDNFSPERYNSKSYYSSVGYSVQNELVKNQKQSGYHETEREEICTIYLSF